MRLAVISDTHGKHDQVKVPECDVLIHCGDWTRIDSKTEWPSFAGWLIQQPADDIIMIHGNHDYPDPEVVQPGQYLKTQITILHDSYARIRGINFYGSPYTPEYFGWNWMLDRNSDALKRKWDEIPPNTNVLITHGPKHGTLDQANGLKAGCELLEARIRELKKLKLHCCGHIHSGYGQTHSGKYINAAVVNENLSVVNPPIIMDL